MDIAGVGVGFILPATITAGYLVEPLQGQGHASTENRSYPGTQQVFRRGNLFLEQPVIRADVAKGRSLHVLPVPAVEVAATAVRTAVIPAIKILVKPGRHLLRQLL